MKIVSEIDYNSDELQITSDVKEILDDYSDIIAGQWYTSLLDEFKEYKIKSPIEQLFFAQWSFLGREEEIPLTPQYKIDKYFVDFVPDTFNFFLDTHTRDDNSVLSQIFSELKLFAVELDGHWHEKTPEQVEKDKQRERFLVSKGFRVVRFSGREIKKDVYKCAKEVWELANSDRIAVMKKYIRLGGW